MQLVQGIDIGLGRGHHDVGIGALSVDEIRTMERLNGEAPRLPDPQPEENTVIGAEALTGGQS